MTLMRKFLVLFAVSLLAIAGSFSTLQAKPAAASEKSNESRSVDSRRVRVPLNLAILVQDDLVPRVGNELKATREFIRALPGGSRVMIGYVRAGALQVRQPFTTDLDHAAKALRIVIGNPSAAPYNPYVEVRDALRRFDGQGTNRNALLLISDGLDVSRGFDWSSSVHSIDLDRAIREARDRNVAIYTFYAPSTGLTSRNRRAVSFGQSALNRLADETGGEAFFQGTSFVTFDSYFRRLSQTINRQYASE